MQDWIARQKYILNTDKIHYENHFLIKKFRPKSFEKCDNSFHLLFRLFIAVLPNKKVEHEIFYPTFKFFGPTRLD